MYSDTLTIDQGYSIEGDLFHKESFRQFFDNQTIKFWDSSQTVEGVDDTISGAFDDITKMSATTATKEASTKALTLQDIIYEARQELLNYLEFAPGWDGYQGEPFSRFTIGIAERTLELIGEFLILHEVTPNELTPGPASDGTVDIELGFGAGHAIISIDGERKTIVFYAETEQGIADETMPIHAAQRLGELVAQAIA